MHVKMYERRVMQATTSEGLAQGPNVAARLGFEPETFRTIGTEHNLWATTLIKKANRQR